MANLNDFRVDQELRSLVAATIVPGSFSYAYERVSDYRSFAETQGREFQVYTAFEGDQLLGSTQITFDRVYFNGAETEIAYSGDTRVSPVVKGRKVADRLIELACAQVIPVFGAVLASNRLVLEKKINDWRRVKVDFQIVGEMKALMCLAGPKKTRPSPKVRWATAADLPEMFQLWVREQSQRNLARVFKNVEDFTSSYEKTPGICLTSTFLVHAAKGELTAFGSVWNQSSIRKIKLHRLSKWAKVMMALLRPWVSFPKEGEELKIAYAFQFCIDSKSGKPAAALDDLISQARSCAAEKGFVFFSIGMDARDPLLRVAKKHSLISNSVKIICANAQPDTRLFHLEVGRG